MATMIQRLSEELRDREKYLMEALAEGNHSYEDYLRLCGEIRGLRHGADYITHLESLAENDDE